MLQPSVLYAVVALLATASAAPAEKRFVLPSIPADLAQGTGGSFLRITPDSVIGGKIIADQEAAANKDNTVWLADPSLLPGFPSGDCDYQYRSLSTITEVNADMFTHDIVQQGTQNDCGVGAALLALMHAGRTKELAATIQPQKGGLKISLKSDFPTGSGQVEDIMIDNNLPSTDKKGCHPLMGYQRPQDEQKGYLIPMLEKAIAKWYFYADTTRASRRTYAGLDNVGTQFIMSGVMRGTPHNIERGDKVYGYQKDMADAARRCWKEKLPCAVAIPGVHRLGNVDKNDGKDGSWINVSDGNEEGRWVRITQDGHLTVKWAPSGPSRNVADFTGQAEIISGHWYAIDVSRSTDQTVVLSNPWGSNPGSKDRFVELEWHAFLATIGAIQRTD